MVIEKRHENFIVESDSLSLVKAVNTSSFYNSYVGLIV